MKVVTPFFAALVACGASTAPVRTTPPVAPAPNASPLVASLEVGPCADGCPAYSLALYANGSVVYVGRANVGRIGEIRSLVDRSVITEVVRTFESARFFELDAATGRLPRVLAAPVTSPDGHTTTYDFSDMLVCGDVAHTRVRFAHDGRERELEDTGCEETDLRHLEIALLGLLGIDPGTVAGGER